MDDRFVLLTQIPEAGIEVAGYGVQVRHLNKLQEVQNNLHDSAVAFYDARQKEEVLKVSFCRALVSVYNYLQSYAAKQTIGENNQTAIKICADIANVFPNLLNQEFRPPEGKQNDCNIDEKIEFSLAEKISAQPIDNDLKEKISQISADIKQLTDEYDNTPSISDEELISSYRQTPPLFKLQVNNYYLNELLKKGEVDAFRQTIVQRNGMLKNKNKERIEKLLSIKEENKAEFSQNRSAFTNSMADLGMDVIWSEEPSYESLFCRELGKMRDDLDSNHCDDNFYQKKLPIFLDLCKNLQIEKPEESKKITKHLQEFMQTPNKMVLRSIIQETEILCSELREIDKAKSSVMRSAWDGYIKVNYEEKDGRKEPVLSNIMKEHLYNRPKVSLKYKGGYYIDGLKKNKIWQVCRKVPQFKKLQSMLFEKLAELSFPPEYVAQLNYNDFAYLLTKDNEPEQKIRIESDSAKFYKKLVANNEKELRILLSDYAKREFTPFLTIEGKKKNKTDEQIKEDINSASKAYVRWMIDGMKKGRCPDKNFNAHHNFSLNNIAYFEKITGLPFSRINDYIVMVNKVLHEHMHGTENDIDKFGKMRNHNNHSYRTKFVANEVFYQDDYGHMHGYMGKAITSVIAAKAGILAMIDINSFVMDKAELSNILIQQNEVTKFAALLQQNNETVTLPHNDSQAIAKYIEQYITEYEKRGMRIRNTSAKIRSILPQYEHKNEKKAKPAKQISLSPQQHNKDIKQVNYA